ncbi:MAG: hypothetical protein HQK84_10460 [Nitrospinae bacterium]|nr:hypothetical protein [Nitrospinota bacterium]
MSIFKNREKIEIEKELEELINHGGGFGCPDARENHKENIEFLKHKLTLIESKKVKAISILSIVIALTSLAVSIFNVFFKG